MKMGTAGGLDRPLAVHRKVKRVTYGADDQHHQNEQTQDEPRRPAAGRVGRLRDAKGVDESCGERFK